MAKKARVYKTRENILKRAGFTFTDVARNLKQARSIVKAYPKGSLIVKTPKYARYGFPYHIATRKR